MHLSFYYYIIISIKLGGFNLNIYDTINNLGTSLKQTEEYKEYISLKEDIKKDEKLYQMLKDFKEKQANYQLNYMNGVKMDDEQTKSMENLYSIIIQNESARKLLESEMKINVILADINKVIGEAIKEIIEF